MLLSEALRVPQAACVDPMMTRAALATLFLDGISWLPEKVLLLPARVVVFRVLIEKVPLTGL